MMRRFADQSTGQAQRSDQSGLRNYNERVVLSLLKAHGGLSKSEVGKRAGFTNQTAAVIMRDLEAEGLITRGEPVRGRVGQPSIPMRLCAEGAFFFGAKLGRRSTDIVLVNFVGEIIDQTSMVYDYPDPQKTISFIVDSVNSMMQSKPQSVRDRIRGLGVAMPGFLWEWATSIGVEPHLIDPWRTIDIQDSLSMQFDFPVWSRNDATCACGAELVFGKDPLPTDFLYFYIGQFIGGGIVLNGELFTGSTGNAGALGPFSVTQSDGSTKQIVEIASLATLQSRLKRAGASSATLVWDAPDYGVCPDVLNNWINDAAHAIAETILAGCAFIDFPMVILDGSMPETLLQRIVQRIQQNFVRLNWSGLFVPDLKCGTIGSNARTLGASAIPMFERYLISV